MQAKNESIHLESVVVRRFVLRLPDGRLSHRIEINPPKTVELTRGIDLIAYLFGGKSTMKREIIR